MILLYFLLKELYIYFAQKKSFLKILTINRQTININSNNKNIY